MNNVYYMAIAQGNGYTVGIGYAVGETKPLAEVRTFDTFDEADEAAKFIAAGLSDFTKGEYVNNR